MRLKGFTLLELLIVLTVLSIITVFGLPLSKSWLQKNYTVKVASEIETAILMARTMALSTNNKLLLMPLNSKDWSQGMKLTKNESNYPVIYLWQWSNPAVKVRWTGFVSDNYLIFAPHLSQNALSGSFSIFSNKQLQRKITLNRLGHATLLF